MWPATCPPGKSYGRVRRFARLPAHLLTEGVPQVLFEAFAAAFPWWPGRWGDSVRRRCAEAPACSWNPVTPRRRRRRSSGSPGIPICARSWCRPALERVREQPGAEIGAGRLPAVGGAQPSGLRRLMTIAFPCAASKPGHEIAAAGPEGADEDTVPATPPAL